MQVFMFSEAICYLNYYSKSRREGSVCHLLTPNEGLMRKHTSVKKLLLLFLFASYN